MRIAAGDINSVVLHVEFDEAWDDFISRKALFVNDAVNSSDTQDILLIGDECIVPHEVLAKDGVLSISVTGYTADGTAKKTSSIVRMKVHESLTDASTTVEPTMDLFMQYLAAMKEEMNPLILYMREMVDIELQTVMNKIEEQREWLNGTVLWVNPDPGAKIETAQTINIDRTAYPRLHILALKTAAANPEADESWQDCICVHSNGKYSVSNQNGDSYRTITVTDTAVIIGESSHTDSSSIPYKIIGYKY